MVTKTVGKPVIAAIGNFDGVHLGHQHLIKLTRDVAGGVDGKTGVVLFDPHPRYYFQPDGEPFLLSQRPIADSLLQSYGVDIIHTVPFNAARAALSPEAFIKKVLIEQLGLKGVLVGSDFRFGAKRAGDGAMMKSIGEAHGLVVHLIDPISNVTASPDLNVDLPNISASKIGSSGIRDAIRAGDMQQAASMLGRPWVLLGHVIQGQKLGRTIGFPTANIELGELVAPLHGVYAVYCHYEGKRHNAIANYGRRPTVGSGSPLLEVHLFDFEADLYGQTLKVEFIDFIRQERKFDGLDNLKTQITKDCDQARAILS